jgi:hypothetical protein
VRRRTPECDRAHFGDRLTSMLPTVTPDQIVTSARYGLSALKWLKRVWKLVPRRRQLVCVPHPLFSGWTATEGLLHARITGSVTNTRAGDGMVMQYVQMRPAGLRYLRAWETCPVWRLGDDFARPGSPGLLLAPRTTAAFDVQYPLRVVRAPNPRRYLRVNVRVVDQLDGKHRFPVRLRCFQRPPAWQAPS